MKKIPTIIFSLILIGLLTNIIYSKTSSEINEQIQYKNNELQKLRTQINELEEKILNKANEAISSSEIVIDLEKKISLTKKLINKLKNEELYLTDRILETKIDIADKSEQIKKQQALIADISVRQYMNKNSDKLDFLFIGDGWNEGLYKSVYYKTFGESSKKLIINLEQSMASLNNQNQKLKLDLNNKKNIISEKQDKNNSLEKDKKKKKSYLDKVKEEKKALEKKYDDKKNMIRDMKNLIAQLSRDKDRVEKQEKELARIREQEKMQTIGNFKQMKGKLIWPINGKIVSKFGKTINEELSTVTQNVGVSIQTNSDNKVISVMDGVVSKIAYIRGFGNLAIINHGDQYSTVYANIDNIRIKENDYVKIGTEIGKASYDDKTKKNKLHFEIWNGENALNPEDWLKKL